MGTNKITKIAIVSKTTAISEENRLSAKYFLKSLCQARPSNTMMAKVAKAGEILADLGVGETQQSAQLAGADRGLPAPQQVLQLAQVEAQPVDHRLGHIVGIGLCKLVFTRAHAEPAAAGALEVTSIAVPDTLSERSAISKPPTGRRHAQVQAQQTFTASHEWRRAG